MSLKKKIFITIGILFIVILATIGVILLVSTDISEEELGPSPFPIDKDYTSEDNPNFKKIIELGKAIKGHKEFEEKFELDLKNPEPSILLLQSYIQTNQEILDKIDPEQFKACKLPKPKIDMEYIEYTSNLLKLIQYAITLNILTNHFEKAKNDIIKVNNISEILFKISPNIHIGMIVLANKKRELENIKLLIDNEQYSTEQKITILNIHQELITKKFLINIAYFETEYFRESIIAMNNRNTNTMHIFSEMPYYPIFTPFFCQPNKTAKLYRESFLTTISLMDNPSFKTYPSLRETNPYNPKPIDFFKGNYGGHISVEMANLIIKAIVRKILTINSIINQLELAKIILLNKTKIGTLPNSLEDLNLKEEFITDIHSGEPFLYFPQNGILQSNGSIGKNYKPDLTNKELTPEEIRAILKADDNGNEFILYLK